MGQQPEQQHPQQQHPQQPQKVQHQPQHGLQSNPQTFLAPHGGQVTGVAVPLPAALGSNPQLLAMTAAAACKVQPTTMQEWQQCVAAFTCGNTQVGNQMMMSSYQSRPA